MTNYEKYTELKEKSKDLMENGSIEDYLNSLRDLQIMKDELAKKQYESELA